MYASREFLLVLCALVAGCSANTFKMGACPRVTAMETMDFDKFVGEWYVIQRFNPMATCTKLNLEKSPEGVYTVNETSRPLGFNFGFHNQYVKARRISFPRNDTTSIFKLDRNLAHFTLGTYGVLSTDYTNYALVWGCEPVLFGSVQNVDVLSRTPSLSEDVLKDARDLLKDMNVDFRPLDFVDQSHCQQASGPDASEPDTNNIVAG